MQLRLTSLGKGGGIWLPMLSNGVIVLSAAELAHISYNAEAVMWVGLVTCNLVVVSGVALVGAVVKGQRQWVIGFAISLGLLLITIFIICGMMVNGGPPSAA